MKLPRANRIGGFLLFFIGWNVASGAGFSIIEQSVKGLGNAFSGGSASADDASTVFYNPAGMTRLKGKDFVGGMQVIHPSIRFSDSGSTISPALGVRR